jgi:hypothetical protein
MLGPMPKGMVSKVNRVNRKTAGGVAGKTAAAGTGASARSAVATPEMVAVRAYEIYLAEGCPEGREVEHWVRAEAELLRN